MIQLWNIIKQSILMRYYTCGRDYVWTALPEYIHHSKESFEVAYVKIDKYTPCD